MRILVVESLRKGLPALLLACALTACGPEQSQDGPVARDGSVAVSPTTLDLDLAPPTGVMVTCTPGSSSALFPVIVTTFNARGFPLGNADITLQLDFSPGTVVVGGVAMALLDSTGTVLLTKTNSPSFTTQTEGDGTARFQLLADTSTACSYAGSLTVNSGSLVTTMQVTATGS